MEISSRRNIERARGFPIANKGEHVITDFLYCSISTDYYTCISLMEKREILELRTLKMCIIYSNVV